MLIQLTDSVKEPKYIKQITGNGIFAALLNSYSYHYNLVLSPDHIHNAIACIWSKYVDLNAEKFRSQIVNHQDKKTLEYISGGSYDPVCNLEFINALFDLVQYDCNLDLSWFGKVNSYTTTTNEDHIIRFGSLLAATKKYYEYKCTLCCGIPSVELLGDREDWLILKNNIESMPTLNDNNLVVWKNLLIEVLYKFIDAYDGIVNMDFWQSCITGQSFGSGPQLIYGGWILLFSPFLENGKWIITPPTSNTPNKYGQVELEDILNLLVDFNITVNDNGYEFVLDANIGQTQLVTLENAITPGNVVNFDIKPCITN